jgi:replicative DNA helicase
MSDIAAGPETQRVIATGLTDLDRTLGGLEYGHQYLIAGRTSMGKSALALGIARHAAMKQGKVVAIFSMEMTHEQVTNRIIAMMTHIPVMRLKPQFRYQLSEDERAAVMEAAGRISDGRIHIDCTPSLKPADVRARASRVQAAHGLDMVIFDHMHIAQANAPTGKQVQDLGAIAIDLANIYKSLGVVGLTLAQLNRGVDARAIKRPVLSDLRESGQIEEAAYVAMFVHREAYYDDTANKGEAEIIIAKNRDGATGAVDVFWKADRAQFLNAAQVTL